MRTYWLLVVLLGAATCTKEQVIPCTTSIGCPVAAPGGAPLLCDLQTGDPKNGLCVTCDQAMLPNGEAGACSASSNGAAPVCDLTTKTCRGCQQDSECPDSQVCSTSDRAVLSLSVPPGQCVPKSQVTAVNSAAGLQTAMTMGVPYVVLAANSYPAISVTSGSVVLIGPQCPSTGSTPAECAPQDLLQTATIAGLSVTGTANVKLDAVTISGGQATCNGAGASLTLLRSAVVQSPSDGVDSPQCNSLIIERSRINGSNGAAINISGGIATYSIRNSVLYKNQGTNAVVLSGSSKADLTFSFNTVVDNTGVVNCSGLTLSSSIVVRNGVMAGSQFTNCVLTDVVVGTGDSATGTGVRKMMPDFMASGALDAPYRLVSDANSLACCIDQLPSGPPNDYFGTARPQPAGGKYDIGFHEFMQ